MLVRDFILFILLCIITLLCLCPHRAEALSDAFVWRLSVAYIGPNSRTERPRKTKIGTEVAHVTRDSDTTFKVRRSKVNLFDGQKRHVACALCFALLWQCRHKLGKIAQCLFFMLLLFVLANSVVNCSLWRVSYLQLIMIRLAGGGGILCRHAHRLFYFILYPIWLSFSSVLWHLLVGQHERHLGCKKRGAGLLVVTTEVKKRSH